MRNNPPRPPDGKPAQELNGRKILLGVCGGIAAYKAVELCRLFVKAGARVQVVMTRAGTKFIAPLTFEAITGRHVFVEMFPEPGEFSPWHTELASWPDLAVIAPATANHMARLAAGLADDLLSTIMLTLDRPRVLCPAMNYRMWQNPATQNNLSILRTRGYRFIMPDEGQMARPGEGEGIGRLAEPEAIYSDIRHLLSTPQDLRGVRVLVTAGRTEESWDPVRVLTNRATGRMGFALAEEARERGADVVLVHGPTDVIPPAGVRIRRVTTAAEMAQAVKQEFAPSRIVLMAAAVADYTFAKTVEHKLKKGQPDAEVHLIATEDILRNLSEKKGDRVVVGFALETENLLENALRKLRDKHLDIVVANNPLTAGSGFAGETNQVLLIHRNGQVTELPLQSKREVARVILDAVIRIYRHPEPEIEPEPEPLEEVPEEIEESEVETESAPPPVVSTPSVSGNGRTGRSPRRRGRGRKKEPSKAAQPEPDSTEVAEEPVAQPIVVEAAAEPPKKAAKTRRGGRRAAKARAKKAGSQAELGVVEQVSSAE
ncbi:bifunctional phosphopantothenoylcysteine decarboxylase/phosphopantothenate--cysteine ligase CoaBC, partial [bacterium]|nr:bifunctional phosphopantothenoylcysteine decarboxylase/phosphopantothenate--cysteine ligase CoaBC [bacterium]